MSCHCIGLIIGRCDVRSSWCLCWPTSWLCWCLWHPTLWPLCGVCGVTYTCIIYLSGVFGLAHVLASFSLRCGSTSPWPLCGGRPRQLILVWSPVPGHYNCDWDRDRETIAKDPESDSSSSLLSSFYQQHKQSFILVWRQTMKKEKSLSLAEMEHIHFCLMRQKYLGWLLERSHSKRALMV